MRRIESDLYHSLFNRAGELYRHVVQLSSRAPEVVREAAIAEIRLCLLNCRRLRNGLEYVDYVDVRRCSAMHREVYGV